MACCAEDEQCLAREIAKVFGRAPEILSAWSPAADGIMSVAMDGRGA